MTKYLLLAILLFSPAQVFAARTSIATEAFGGTLGNFASINATNATPSITAGQATCSHSNECTLIYTGAGSFTNDQYAEMDVIFGGGTLSNGVEILARISADTEANRDYFMCKVSDDTGGAGSASRDLKAFKVTDATPVQIGSTSTTSWTSGDKVSIEVTGVSPNITVKCFHNSTNEITVNNETTFSTGSVGYAIWGQFSAGDNWVGGNITASSSAIRHTVVNQ